MSIRKIAVVGAGVIGTHHGLVISQLADRIQLVAVADINIERAERLAAERGGRPFASLTDALAAVDIDIVVVCTPTGRHGEVAMEALAAGKHVIVEKPAEITVERTDEIIEAQQKAGTLVTVISQHRFDPATDVTLAAIERGELGRLTSGIASIDWWRGQSYYDSGDWRGTWALDGGGALMNQGHHSIDLLVWFLGEPVEVFARTNRLAHERIEVEDVAVATIRFADGALGVVHATTAAYPGLRASVGVYGERGSAVLEDDRLVYFHAAEGDNPPAYDYGAAGRANQAAKVLPASTLAPGAPAIAGLATTSHTAQFIDFLDAVEHGRPPLVTTEEAIRTLVVIRGMYESVRTNALVRLSEL